MPTKWMGPIWLGSFMLSDPQQAPRPGLTLDRIRRFH
jgi:hypothetical protein